MMTKPLDLVRGGVLLGTIQPGDGQPPWHTGSFTPTPAYETVRPLFERELRLLRANTDDDADQWEDWEAAHDELHGPGLALQSKDRSYVADDDLLIHIDGASAWWRDDGGD